MKRQQKKRGYVKAIRTKRLSRRNKAFLRLLLHSIRLLCLVFLVFLLSFFPV
jgi:hypothetical protein